MTPPAEHVFGGDWTDLKLQVLKKYLSAYSTALKDKPTPVRPFTKLYVDAFAGTGYRSLKEEDGHPNELLFPELAETSAIELLDGSARIALKAEPSFEQYVFIEKSSARCAELEKLKDEFPAIRERIEIRQGEANAQIQALCNGQASFWKSRRAVMFLDPYGMQVDWATVEAIARTKAIDLWLLFPLGIGTNRLLTRDGRIPEKWRQKLDSFLGTRDWYDKLYLKPEHKQGDLFGETESPVEKVSIDVLGQYFNHRLKSVFAGVSEYPAVLENSKGSPMYLFCFAASNTNGAKVAIRIANDILMKVSNGK